MMLQELFLSKIKPESKLDFRNEPYDQSKDKIIGYWENHASLNAWMEELYWNALDDPPDDPDDPFCGNSIELSKDDLIKLRWDIQGRRLPLFLGKYTSYENEEEEEEDWELKNMQRDRKDMKIIKESLKYINGGFYVYYIGTW